MFGKYEKVGGDTDGGVEALDFEIEFHGRVIEVHGVIDRREQNKLQLSQELTEDQWRELLLKGDLWIDAEESEGDRPYGFGFREGVFNETRAEHERAQDVC